MEEGRKEGQKEEKVEKEERRKGNQGRASLRPASWTSTLAGSTGPPHLP